MRSDERVCRMLPRVSVAGLLMLLVLLLLRGAGDLSGGVHRRRVDQRRRTRRVSAGSDQPAATSPAWRMMSMSSVNTLLVAFGATVMAVVIGFVLAWILTRTNIPGRGAAGTADGAAVLHDPAGRRDGLGHPGRAEDRPAEPGSGACWADAAICSTSTRRWASPG